MGKGWIFIADKFDAVISIPLRLVQQKSLAEVLAEHIGKEDYQKLIESLGSRCLIILEGLDEMAFDHQLTRGSFLCGLGEGA